MPATKITLTREELYALVWSKPMRTLAQELSISDVGLAKNCRKMNIPLPGLGYWAKKAAGKPVTQTPLPTLPPNSATVPQRVTFSAGEPAPVVAAAPPPIERPAPVAAQAEYESDPANRIVVAETLRSPHALVQKTIESFDHDAARDERDWRFKSKPRLDIEVSKQRLKRALRVADALIKAFDTRGWKTTLGRIEEHRPTVRSTVTILEIPVSFGIFEPMKKVRVETPADPPSIAEKILTSTTKRPSAKPKYRDEWSGHLGLLVRNPYTDSIADRIVETDAVAIEERLNDFVVTLVSVAHVAAEQRRKQIEEWEAERAAEEKERQEQQRRKMESRRGAALQRQARQWIASRSIGEYLTAVREAAAREPGGIEPGSDFARWLEWAEEYGRSLDPLQRPLSDLLIVPPEDPEPSLAANRHLDRAYLPRPFTGYHRR